jgi:hypothetical protein
MLNLCFPPVSFSSADLTDVVASLVPSSVVPAASDGPEGSPSTNAKQSGLLIQPDASQDFNPPGASCNIFDDVCCQGFWLRVAIFVVSQRKTPCLPPREFTPFIFAHLVPIIRRPLPPLFHGKDGTGRGGKQVFIDEKS